MWCLSPLAGACLRERGVLCSGKCCHRGDGGGGEPCSIAHFFLQKAAPLFPHGLSPAPRPVSQTGGPRPATARRRRAGAAERTVFTQEILGLLTKLSVYSIDIVRLTPNQPEFRTCAPTKRHKTVRPSGLPPAPHPTHSESMPVSAKAARPAILAGRAAHDPGGLHVVVDLLLPKRP